MDEVLCDELLQEVLTRLPPPSSRAVSLVSKRWLHLYRSSKSSLSLRLGADVSATIPDLSLLLSQYPSLSSLSLLLFPSPDASISDHLLLLIVSSPFSSNLTTLRFLAGAVTTSSLLSLSRTCTHLISLTISLPRPLFFTWLADCRSLKELSISVSISSTETPISDQFEDFELTLETLSLSGIRVNESGLGLLWRSCRNLRKLQLKSCEGLGDGGSYSSFTNSLPGLRQVELRTCRAIVDGVLLRLAEHCESLTSLLVYDGGSKDGLLRFITSSRSDLKRLDLRLPLDFKNDHLFALSLNFRTLSCLRLQSCCLVTGDGLKTFVSGHLEELALINCDVVEREPGLLATLGQHLRHLRKLDLSYNEMMPDKELVSMLVSCSGLVDLRLRGCKGLSSGLVGSVSKNCNWLENIDIVHCCGVDSEAVESLLLNCPQLKRVQVEEGKVSDVARKHALMKFIEVVS